MNIKEITDPGYIEGFGAGIRAAATAFVITCEHQRKCAAAKKECSNCYRLKKFIDSTFDQSLINNS